MNSKYTDNEVLDNYLNENSVSKLKAIRHRAFCFLKLLKDFHVISHDVSFVMNDSIASN